MAMVAADTVVGHTIIIRGMDNIMAAAVFPTHLLQAPAFMDGRSKLQNSYREISKWKWKNEKIWKTQIVHSLGPEPPQNPDLQTQPVMMTLKQFLATQDDSISDSDAIDKYNEYKLEFKRQQLNEFFVAHKDEEW